MVILLFPARRGPATLESAGFGSDFHEEVDERVELTDDFNDEASTSGIMSRYFAKMFGYRLSAGTVKGLDVADLTTFGEPICSFLGDFGSGESRIITDSTDRGESGASFFKSGLFGMGVCNLLKSDSFGLLFAGRLGVSAANLRFMFA